MILCTPPCQHQDYCAYYGCPFMREPQSFCTRDRREAMPHHARGTHPVDRPGLSVLGKREGPSRKTEQGAGTTLNAHEPGTRSFSARERQVTDDAHHVRSAIVNSVRVA